MPDLDSSQRAFCEAPTTNIRLLAPAGCGKTISLLYRCLYLTQQNPKHRLRFLVVTFTVAARQELQARLNGDPEFSQLKDNVEITTLNSWGWRRVRNIAVGPKLVTDNDAKHFTVLNQLQPIWMNHEAIRAAIQAKPNFTPRRILDAIDAFKSLGFDHLRHTSYSAFCGHLDVLDQQHLEWRYQEHLDQLIQYGVLPEPTDQPNLFDSSMATEATPRQVFDSFYQFWLESCAHLRGTATFTLEDQKYIAYQDEVEKLNGDGILTGAASYNHVLIDEFQDINPLDLNLIRAIAKRNRALVTIVGDDDQAIFEWRGATPEYILNPDEYVGGPFETHTLAVNYRSPRNIVDRSQRLIRHNTRRVDKAIAAHSTDDADIEVRKTHHLTDAMEYVYSIVAASVEAGHSPSRVAIIGRKRSQIIPYQVYFASKDISFCAAEDLQVFLSGAFERILELMMIKTRATTTRRKAQVIDDILQLCDLSKRYQLKKADKESLKRHLQKSSARSTMDAVSELTAYRGPLKGKNKDGAMSIAMASAAQQFLSAQTVTDALLVLSEEFQGLQFDLGKAEDDIFYTDPPFWHLAEFAEKYEDDYDRFVDDIERAKEQLVYVPPVDDDSAPSDADELWKRPLHLMTAIRAKGKEFDVVVLLGAVDGIWPNRHARTPQQMEAERRVFYVAFTRARKRVVILVDARMGAQEAVVSPYIAELGLSL